MSRSDHLATVTCERCGAAVKVPEYCANLDMTCPHCFQAIRGHPPRKMSEAAPLRPVPHCDSPQPSDRKGNQRVAYISPDDYRVNGEKASLYWGFGILASVLLFITVAEQAGILLFVVAATAVSVWIQQSRLVGNAAKVSDKQFSKIHAIVDESAERLGMHPPEVFVRQDPTLNAFAIGFLGRKSVVLHSATVEAMDERELEHIIGHELSHIKCGHTNLTVLTSSSQGINIPVISWFLGFIFLAWSRKAEYTCDRGGLLASRDPRAAASAMCKLAVGPALFKQMDIDDFLNQQMALDQNDVAKLSEKLATHPYLIKRIQAILEYFESDEYERLSNRNSQSSLLRTVGQPLC